MIRTLVLAGSLLPVVCLAANRANAADWPAWLGPARNGASSETVGPGKAIRRLSGGKRRESRSARRSWLTARLRSRLGHRQRIRRGVALDAKTGKPVWHDSYPRAKYRSQLGAGPARHAGVADGQLFTYGITGALSCYDAKTGKLRWRTNPYEANKLTLPRFGVCSSPIVAAGRDRARRRSRLRHCCVRRG